MPLPKLHSNTKEIEATFDKGAQTLPLQQLEMFGSTCSAKNKEKNKTEEIGFFNYMNDEMDGESDGTDASEECESSSEESTSENNEDIGTAYLLSKLKRYLKNNKDLEKRL